VKALRRPDGTTKASPGFQGPTYPRHNARESRCSASRVRPIRHAICWGLGKRRLSVKERRRLPVEGRLASQVRVSKDDCSFAPERLRDGPGNFDPVAPSSVAIEGRGRGSFKSQRPLVGTCRLLWPRSKKDRLYTEMMQNLPFFFLRDYHPRWSPLPGELDLAAGA
jgi:hypothetical protein